MKLQEESKKLYKIEHTDNLDQIQVYGYGWSNNIIWTQKIQAIQNIITSSPGSQSSLIIRIDSRLIDYSGSSQSFYDSRGRFGTDQFKPQVRDILFIKLIN